MTDSSAAHQFQVDLRGVIDLLSRHIYSSPRVFLRELLQNAVDAIAARRALDGGGGRIRITPVSAASDEFVLRDDGIGLTEAEVADLLATVGRSSKRDIFDLPRGDFLGQFGIGMLSCFMVCDTIVIRSRSAARGGAVEWTGHADGTFTVSPYAGDLPVGTSVHLTPRADTRSLLETSTVLDLAETFGRYLPHTVVVDLPGGGETTVTGGRGPGAGARAAGPAPRQLRGVRRRRARSTPRSASSGTARTRSACSPRRCTCSRRPRCSAATRTPPT
ncbi:ATP-binding protein [Microbacterium sp. NPDC080220]|uniref:ATP-binding protein n=1 Tax=Microbacterium sp. NPDC080220 TaxID=3161017 RepID=UPI003433BBFA